MYRVAIHRRNAGVTLVELCITCGITFFLVALTLPALHRERSQAAMVSCANNLRQISVALNLYGLDNHFQMPVTYSTSGCTLLATVDLKPQIERLGLLLGDWEAVTNNWIKSPKYTYLQSRKVLFCPGKSYEGWNPDFQFSEEDCGYSYCVPKSENSATYHASWRRGQVISNDAPAPWDGFYGERNLKWHAMVACYVETLGAAFGVGPGIPNVTLNRPHGNQGVNVLFDDNSVRWVDRPAEGWPNTPVWVGAKEAGNDLDYMGFWCDAAKGVNRMN